MFVKNVSGFTIHFYPPMLNQIAKQEKIKIVIASLATATLLIGSIYWICSQFWQSRRVTYNNHDDSSFQFPLDSNTNKDFSHSPKKSTLRDSDFSLRSSVSPKKENKKPIENEAALATLKASKKEDEISLKNEQPIEEVFNEDDISPTVIEPIHPILPLAQKVSVRIPSCQEAGFVGDTPNLIPHIDKFKLANQVPLDLDSTDIIITLNCFNLPLGLSLPSTIYLPASLFENVKEGNVVQIYYENQLLELCLHQAKEKTKFQEGNFEEVLELAKLETLDKGRPLFGRFIPYSWYKLDGGTVYRVVLGDNDQLKIKAVPSSQFRSLQRTGKVNISDDLGERRLTEQNILNDFPLDILEKKEGVYFIGDLPGFSKENIDCIELILNEKLWAAHILPRPTDATIMVGKKEIPIYRNPQEFVIGFKWKKIFPSLTLSELQAKIEQAKVLLRDGIFQIFIPNH